MKAQGVPPPTPALMETLQQKLGMEGAMLVSLITDRLPGAQKFEPKLTPAAVSANSESTQAFTVAGLAETDVVLANKPSRQAGLNIVQAWASADNTLSLTFQNTSGSAITPAAEIYRIFAFRLG